MMRPVRAIALFIMQYLSMRSPQAKAERKRRECDCISTSSFHPAVLKFVDAQAPDAKIERRRSKPQCSRRAVRAGDATARCAKRGLDSFALLRPESFIHISRQIGLRKRVALDAEDAVAGEDDRPFDEIGRASCRERGRGAGGED